MLHLQQNKLLDFQTLQRLVLDYDVLANTFHRKEVVVYTVLDEVDFTEGATPNMLYNFVVFQREL